MPDSEQDKILGAHFQDFWAEPFESLAARNPKMEMFHFPCSVGVNNLEYKTWEEEQDALPVSHESDIIVDSPTERRRGVLGSMYVIMSMQLGPTPTGSFQSQSKALC